MKTPLIELAEDMISEIKNLKDLTKQELPEIAKEYIKYHQVFYLSGFLLFLLGIPLSIIAWKYGSDHGGNINGRANCETFIMVVGFRAIPICVIGLLINGYSFLEYKFMPRRKAIEAITSLTKG